MALTARNTSMNLEYAVESSQGTDPSSGTLFIPSDGIENINLVGRRNGEVVYSINDYDGQGTVYAGEEYTLTFDYYLQRHNPTTSHPLANSIEYYALTRSSGELTPLTFYVTTSSGATFTLMGGIINRWTATPEDTRIRCSCEVIAESCATSSDNYNDLTASQAIGTTFETFQGAACTRSGSFEAGVGGFSVEINNNVERIPVIGSSTPTLCQEGHEAVTGTVDILLNDGGKADFSEMKYATEQSIIFSSGTSTATNDKSMKWTFANASFDEIPITWSIDTSVVISGVRWKAETLTLAAYS